MEKDFFEYIRIVVKPYTIHIMKYLLIRPMRYKDLTKVCPNDKTLSLRLRELQDENLIETILKRENNRSFIYYKITDKGNKLLHLINSINKKFNSS